MLNRFDDWWRWFYQFMALLGKLMLLDSLALTKRHQIAGAAMLCCSEVWFSRQPRSSGLRMGHPNPLNLMNLMKTGIKND